MKPRPLWPLRTPRPGGHKPVLSAVEGARSYSPARAVNRAGHFGVQLRRTLVTAIIFDNRCHVGFHRLTRVLAVAVSLLCTACDSSSLSEPAPTISTSIGSQCQLPNGPLGVCQEVPCEPGVQRPCFKCTSQH